MNRLCVFHSSLLYMSYYTLLCPMMRPPISSTLKFPLQSRYSSLRSAQQASTSAPTSKTSHTYNHSQPQSIIHQCPDVLVNLRISQTPILPNSSSPILHSPTLPLSCPNWHGSIHEKHRQSTYAACFAMIRALIAREHSGLRFLLGEPPAKSIHTSE